MPAYWRAQPTGETSVQAGVISYIEWVDSGNEKRILLNESVHLQYFA
jgi:hypothetical protein